MLNKYARWIFEWPLNLLARKLQAARITPNMVSIGGFILTILSALIIGNGAFVVGAIVLSIAAINDMLDGALARLTQPSTFGAFLDSTLDRYSESITCFGLMYFFMTRPGHEMELMLVFLMLVGSLMVSYTRARAEGLNVECNAGLLQRPERVVLLIAGLLLPGVLVPILWILAILSNFTALQRIYEVYIRTSQTQINVPPQKEA